MAIDFLTGVCPKKWKVKTNSWVGKIIKKGHEIKNGKGKALSTRCIKHPDGMVVEVIVGGGWTGFPFYFSLKKIKNAFYLIATFSSNPLPAGEKPNDDDLDEPDEPDQPLLDDGPPPLGGCECNAPGNDQNICFDDTFFGKPNPSEIKPELTVIGRV